MFNDPKLFVTTYFEYNNGGSKGDWINLCFEDKDTFLDKCKALFPNENDPEFMFTTYENIPTVLYNESFVSEALFDWVAWYDDNYIDNDKVQAFTDWLDMNPSEAPEMSEAIEKFESEYRGQFKDLNSFVIDYVNDNEILSRIPSDLQDYFNYDRYQEYLENSCGLWISKNKYVFM